MMYFNKTYFLFVACLFCLITSCKKDEVVISDTPEIAFVSITPTQAKEYQDSITVVISYKDGDGDLGENDANVKNLFLTDSRNGVVYKYRIQQLAPGGSTIAIQGNLNVVVDNTAITNGSSSQTVTYSVYLVDRSGHQSNTITTSPLTIIN